MRLFLKCLWMAACWGGAAAFAALPAGKTPLPDAIAPTFPPLLLREKSDVPDTSFVNEKGSRLNVSVPTLTPYLPPRETATGLALIVFPGGGYHHLDWTNHVQALARRFNPMGVAVIALKYRTRPPVDDVEPAALADARRAVRLTRAHAKDWGIERLGVVGFSAGAHLAMSLAGNFDGGDPSAADPVARFSSRPDFIVSLSTWAHRQSVSPFTFRDDTPPVMLGHAQDDRSAPIALAYAVAAALRERGVPVRLEVRAQHGHGAFHLMPGRSGADWPDVLETWLASLKLLPKPFVRCAPPAAL